MPADFLISSLCFVEANLKSIFHAVDTHQLMVQGGIREIASVAGEDSLALNMWQSSFIKWLVLMRTPGNWLQTGPG